jgi:gluconolactonase
MRGFGARRLIRLFLLMTLALGGARSVDAADDYQLGPDSQPKDGVPRGKIEKFAFASSKIFPGTVRDNWIYVPAQYRRDVPACVMVFQDGGRFVPLDGPWRVPIVFDNLIHKKEMPITIGVFTNPGVLPAPRPNAQPRFNRSFEYDGLGDDYVRFLLEELLPEVGKRYSLSNDPNCRAIAGSSSGAIAAFTAAWHRPDAFRRVFSSIGTYVGLRGGEVYPTLVRKSEPRPLRVFLQDGSGDLNGYGGNWWIANQAMLSALEFAGYEVAHVFGDGGHNAKHAASILPDALRFLWKGFPSAPKVAVGSKQPVLDVIGVDKNDGDPEGAKAGWESIGEGYGRLAAVAAAPGGDLYFSDVGAGRIYRVAAGGKPVVFVEQSGGASGLAVSADGGLFAARPGRKEIVAFDTQARPTVVATGIAASDLAVTHAGVLFATEPSTGRVFAVAPGGQPRMVASNLGTPNGLALTADQAFLYVSDSRGRFVSSFEVLADGTLDHAQRFCHLHLDDRLPDSGADGLTVDVTGRLYVATRSGLQFCDQAGRVNGIISAPDRTWFAQATFAGPKLATLYAITEKRLYRRPSKTNGALSAEPPIKPPTPRL